MSGALLAFELSGPTCTAALVHGAGLMTEAEFSGARGRALLSETDALLRAAGLRRADLRGVVVGTGPGSYTGLRIACAAASALGYALAIPCGGLGSLPAAALAAPAGTELHLLVDAFRGEVYHAAYRRTPAGLEELVAPQLLRRDEVAAAVPRNAFLAGDAQLCPHPTQALGAQVEPRATRLLELALLRGARLDGIGVAELGAPLPLYLRPAAFRPATS
jgi:tRNA threonylcarbamoyladenosine biosynthesis protein TsaB